MARSLGVPRCIPREAALIVLATACLAAAAWMTINRNSGYNVSYTPYRSLHTLAGQPHIAAINWEPAEAQLSFDLSGISPKSLPSFMNGIKTERAEIVGEGIMVNIEPGRNRYSLHTPEGAALFEFTTMWGEGISIPSVGRMSVPLQPSAPFAFSDFVTQIEHFDAQEVAQAREILSGMSPQPHYESDLHKAQHIAATLHQSLFPHRGFPKPLMQNLSGWGQYSAALAGKSGVYCGNHSEIYAFFANVAGIPTRIVDVSGRLGGANLGAHTFNESYIKELGRWVYIDLQIGSAGIRNASGTYLSDLLHHIDRGDTAELVLTQMSAGKTRELSYKTIQANIETLISSNASLVYLWAYPKNRFGLGPKLDRLFINPQPAYSLVEMGPGAMPRIALYWSTLFLVIFWLAIRLRHHLGRCNCVQQKLTQ